MLLWWAVRGEHVDRGSIYIIWMRKEYHKIDDNLSWFYLVISFVRCLSLFVPNTSHFLSCCFPSLSCSFGTRLLGLRILRRRVKECFQLCIYFYVSLCVMARWDL